VSKVAIVIDSTTYLPAKYLEKYVIRVAPALVIWSGEEFEDGVDIQPKEFYTRLQSAKEMPTTSQPSPATMKALYEELIGQGYDVLGVFISHNLSGTVDSAEQAKAMMPEAKVEIVDTLTASMGAGWPILMAAQAAKKGASLAECKAIAENARDKTHTLFVVDTLEFLHRGGRIGGAQRFIGTALNFKPILEVQNGRIEPLERVRTSKKAVNRLIDVAEERVGGQQPVYLSVLHANAPEAAKELLKQAAARLNPVEKVLSDVSPAVGTHTGPGTLGIAVMAGYK
jgi:DegV family protein with EDD domain